MSRVCWHSAEGQFLSSGLVSSRTRPEAGYARVCLPAKAAELSQYMADNPKWAKEEVQQAELLLLSWNCKLVHVFHRRLHCPIGWHCHVRHHCEAKCLQNSCVGLQEDKAEKEEKLKQQQLRERAKSDASDAGMPTPENLRGYW